MRKDTQIAPTFASEAGVLMVFPTKGSATLFFHDPCSALLCRLYAHCISFLFKEERFCQIHIVGFVPFSYIVRLCLQRLCPVRKTVTTTLTPCGELPLTRPLNLAGHVLDQKKHSEKEIQWRTTDVVNLKVKGASYVVFVYTDTPAGINDYCTDHLLNS